MGVRDTKGGSSDRRAESTNAALSGARRLLRRIRGKLGEWSRVHTRRQVELLAGQPPEE